MIVGDDLYMIIFPDTDTPAWDEMSMRDSVIASASSGPQADDLRISGAQIDANGPAGHFSERAFVGWGVFQVFRYTVSS